MNVFILIVVTLVVTLFMLLHHSALHLDGLAQSPSYKLNSKGTSSEQAELKRLLADTQKLLTDIIGSNVSVNPKILKEMGDLVGSEKSIVEKATASPSDMHYRFAVSSAH